MNNEIIINPIRFQPTISGEGMEEFENGQWIRLEDYKKVIKALIVAIPALERAERTIASLSNKIENETGKHTASREWLLSLTH